MMKSMKLLSAAVLISGIPVMTTHAQKPEGHYAKVNGLRMYYELHGPESGRPLVLLHGAFSNIDTDFGKMLPTLAKTRRVIAIELQAHGRTADIDRRLTYEAMADDVAALLRHLRVTNADFLGYSMGGAVAVQVAISHPAVVRRVVFFGGPTYSPDGAVPELLEFEKTMTAEQVSGTPWHKAYLEIAPRPQDFPKLVERIKELDLNWRGFPPDAVRAIQAPVMLIAGDADVARLEHVVEFLRLMGGGVAGDLVGLPKARLAVLPGTTHVTIVERGDWILPMALEFFEAEIKAR